MMKSVNRGVRSTVFGIQALLCLLIIFSGCGTKEALKRISDEDLLRERATMYWNHKVKKEFDKSYAYEYPLFRKQMSVVDYIKGFNTGKASWAGAKIEQVDMQGDSATVGMKIAIQIVVTSSRNLEHETYVEDKWVKVDGVWYHVPQKFRERKSIQ